MWGSNTKTLTRSPLHYLCSINCRNPGHSRSALEDICYLSICLLAFKQILCCRPKKRWGRSGCRRPTILAARNEHIQCSCHLYNNGTTRYKRDTRLTIETTQAQTAFWIAHMDEATCHPTMGLTKATMTIPV
jgi:hypothetical protein